MKQQTLTPPINHFSMEKDGIEVIINRIGKRLIEVVVLNHWTMGKIVRRYVK